MAETSRQGTWQKGNTSRVVDTKKYTIRTNVVLLLDLEHPKDDLIIKQKDQIQSAIS